MSFNSRNPPPGCRKQARASPQVIVGARAGTSGRGACTPGLAPTQVSVLQMPPALLYLPAPGLPKPTLSSKDTPSPARHPSPEAGSPLTPPAFPQQDCPPLQDGIEKKCVFSCGTRTGWRLPRKRRPRAWGEGAGEQEGRRAGGSGSHREDPRARQASRPTSSGKAGQARGHREALEGGRWEGRRDRAGFAFSLKSHWQFLTAAMLCQLSGRPLQSVHWDRCRTELTARPTALQGALVMPNVPSGDADILPHPYRRY